MSELGRSPRTNVSVVGVWERGRFQIPSADTEIHAGTVLVLAGSRADLDAYDEAFAVYRSSPAPIVIIGGGRVGRATGDALRGEGIDYRIVERLPSGSGTRTSTCWATPPSWRCCTMPASRRRRRSWSRRTTTT